MSSSTSCLNDIFLPSASAIFVSPEKQPPAESPSTIYTSVLLGSRELQSASLPGSADDSRSPLRRVSSRAFRAASRALLAVTVFSITVLATIGVSSKNSVSFSLVKLSTIPLTSEFPSLVLVCPSNCGSLTLTLITDVIPSRQSSPLRLKSIPSNKLFLRP